MTLDDIEPDVTYVLTDEMGRLFRFAGCKPTCHYCDEAIKTGDKFKLAYCGNRDVMLCDEHTAEQQEAKEDREELLLRADVPATATGTLYSGCGAGFSRPHKPQ